MISCLLVTMPTVQENAITLTRSITIAGIADCSAFKELQLDHIRGRAINYYSCDNLSIEIPIPLTPVV